MDRFRNRLAALIAAGVLLAYLVYSLFFHNDSFSLLHLGAFALVCVLVLAPFLTRVKIPNVIEFDTKLDELREQTQREIGELRNVVTASTSVRLNPVQHQYTVFGLGAEGELKQLVESLTSETIRDTDGGSVGAENDFAKFRRESRVLDDFQMTLKAARLIQIAYEKKRRFVASEMGPDDSLEKANFLVDCMLGGLEYFVRKEDLPAVKAKLETYRKLGSIYMDVYHRKRKAPSPAEMDGMIQAIAEANETIMIGIALFVGGAVISQRRIEDALPYFQKGEMPPGSLFEKEET